MVFSCSLATLASGSYANAAEISFLCAGDLKPAMDVFLPDFERTSGHKVTVSFAAVGALTKRVQKGELADVVIVSGPQIEGLQAQGKIVAGSRANVAKIGIGAVVRKGAPK